MLDGCPTWLKTKRLKVVVATCVEPRRGSGSAVTLLKSGRFAETFLRSAFAVFARGSLLLDQMVFRLSLI